MADAKLKTKAKTGEEKDKAPPPPVGVILELFFPRTKTVLPTNYKTEAEAVRGAFAHFTAFPGGYAQIRDAPTNTVILKHQELFQRFREK